MSQKQRQKKLARLEELEAERLAIIQRRQEKMAPYYRLLRKFAITLFCTIVVLYIGLVINGQLSHIAQKLTKG